MDTLSRVLRYEMFFGLAGLIVVVAYRMFTRQINTDGLLRDKINGRALSAGRLQMLVITILIAIYYVAEVVDKQKLPDMPQEFLFALAGSHLIYLGGKAFGLIASKLELAANRIVGKLQ